MLSRKAFCNHVLLGHDYKMGTEEEKEDAIWENYEKFPEQEKRQKKT